LRDTADANIHYILYKMLAFYGLSSAIQYLRFVLYIFYD